MSATYRPAPIASLSHILLFANASGLQSFLVSTFNQSEIRDSTFSKNLLEVMPSLGVHAPAKIFLRFNAIATTLSTDEIERLSNKDVQIVSNEVCSLPPFKEEPLNTCTAASFIELDSDRLPLAWPLQSIGITQGYRYSGKGIRIALLDGGVDPYHPDLVSRVRQENIASFVPDETNEANGPAKEHGTHCAGILAASRCSIGGRRYCVSPDVTLLVGKVLRNSKEAVEGRADWVMAGIEWAVSNGATIISMSIEMLRKPDEQPYPAFTKIAEKCLEGGVLMVAAAGNRRWSQDNNPVSSPAACKPVIGVSAVDENCAIFEFCRRAWDKAGKIDVAAPGVSVHSCWPGGEFRRLSGTSMAVPYVAGAAALFWEAYPNLSARELRKQIICNANTTCGIGDDFGGRLLRVP